MFMSETIGGYSQTIRFTPNGNELEINLHGKTLFKGIAGFIHDSGNKIRFKDEAGKDHEIIKYMSYTYA